MGTAEWYYDGDSLIRLVGEIDMANASNLAKALAAIKGPDLIFDCSELTFIDSSGLHVIALTDKRLQERGGRVRLINVQEHVATG
jgi:anti-anti-sigma factor